MMAVVALDGNAQGTGARVGAAEDDPASADDDAIVSLAIDEDCPFATREEKDGVNRLNG